MNEINCKQYGQIEADGSLQLEISEQGDTMLYKNTEAFQAKEGICYAITELDALGEMVTFTYNDFLEEAEGNERLARNCFEMTGEMNMYPDYYFEMGLEEGWFAQCECGHVFDHHKNDKCDRCGSRELLVGDWNDLGEDEE